MLWLYNLPDWLMALVIVAAIVAASYAAYFAFHRLARPSFTDDNKGVALTVLTVVATITALLLAFVAVSVWEAYGAAENAVVAEANTVGALARDLAIFDSAKSREARRQLREYADMVVKVEWQEMRRGQASASVWTAFDQMFFAVGSIEPDTPRRTVILPEIWARTNELLKERRTRLHTAESAVPLALWMVALIGMALTIGTTFALTPTRFHVSMIGTVAVSLALVLYLIVAMDRPFAGEQSINGEAFHNAIENMDRWDSEIAKPLSEASLGRR